ncbi:MAG: hypothetical protein ABII96_00230 [Candidatus Zixiibacteriota bacterium]
MGVIMQAFYWDCPKTENKEYQWWSHNKKQGSFSEKYWLHRPLASSCQ